MVSNNSDLVICPKCDSKNIVKSDEDVYIVRDNNDFIRRKLYRCNSCHKFFTYDNEPRKEPKKIDTIQNIFGTISKKCEKVVNTVSIN